MSGVFFKNYPCHSSEDVIAAVRCYKLNPLRNSFRTDSPSRPFETIRKIRKTNLNRLSDYLENMGKTAPNHSPNTSKSSKIIRVDKANGDSGNKLFNQERDRRSPIPKANYFGDRRDEAGDTRQRGYLHSQNAGLHSTIKPARSPDRLGEFNVNAVDIPQRNYAESSRGAGWRSPTRESPKKLTESLFSEECCKNSCEISPRNFNAEQRFLVEDDIERECEDKKCKECGMELDLEKYKHSQSSKDKGVQVTMYHCNDCRRHVKYNQEYIPPLVISDSEAESILTNAEEESAHGTFATLHLDPELRYTESGDSDQRSYHKQEKSSEKPHDQVKGETDLRDFITLLQPTGTGNNNSNNETIREEVPCCDDLIQANATVNEPLAQTSGFLVKALNKLNSYGVFTKFTIAISICLLTLSVIWMMGAGNYFYSNSKSEEKSELTYVEWASNIFTLIVDRSKKPFWFSLKTLF